MNACEDNEDIFDPAKVKRKTAEWELVLRQNPWSMMSLLPTKIF